MRLCVYASAACLGHNTERSFVASFVACTCKRVKLGKAVAVSCNAKGLHTSQAGWFSKWHALACLKCRDAARRKAVLRSSATP